MVARLPWEQEEQFNSDIFNHLGAGSNDVSFFSTYLRFGECALREIETLTATIILLQDECGCLSK